MDRIPKSLLDQTVPVEAAANRPLLLDDPGQVWIVRSGQVDVFWVQVKEGVPVGHRTHLFRASEGQALFGADLSRQGEEVGLLAVGLPGTLLVSLKRSRIAERANEDDGGVLISQWIEGWIEGLSSGIGKDLLPPRKHRPLGIGPQTEGEPGAYLRPSGPLIWVKRLKGRFFFMGREDCPPVPSDLFFPVSRTAWLRSEGECELLGMDTRGLLEEGALWSSLDAFHGWTRLCLSAIRRTRAEAGKRQLEWREETDRFTLSSALSRLGTILARGKPRAVWAVDERDPLVASCQMVGMALRIPVGSPRKSGGERSPSTTLEDVARGSKFRFRQVILKDDWWRKDSGPMLAYVEEDRRPVALIPDSSCSYELNDPTRRTRERVTRSIAECLAPQAYTFYRPFPERPLSYRDLIVFSLPGCWKDIATVLVMGTIAALLGLLTPLMTGLIFDTVIPEAARGQLLQITMILVVCTLATLVFEIVKGVAILRVEGRMDLSTQSALWDRLLALPVPFFRQYSSGDLANRAMGVAVIRQVLSGVTINTILASLFSSLNLALLFYYDWQLALIAIALSLCGILVTSVFIFLQVRDQKAIFDSEGKTAGTVLQFLTGIAKLRVSGTEDRAFAVWARQFADKKRLSFKIGLISSALNTFNATFPVLVSMGIFAWVIFRESGTLTTGGLLAFIAAQTGFQNALLQMTMTLVPVLIVIPLYQRAMPILQALPETGVAKARPGEVSGEVEVSHVTFRYQMDGPLILKDVSVQVSPGEFVAIVGPSGCGKSTLFRVLLGFESPESGTVYYDGQDLASVDVEDVRRQIGVVLQGGKLMPGSIFKNIIGASNLTLDDAWEAAAMVGFEEDVRAMPMGMHTVISPGGGNLSGGQRQRLLIARAIVKRPRILYFDEATSALDNRTQAVVSRSLEQLQATRVVIAHRLSTVMNAHRIYAMKDGEVVQSGTYDSMIHEPGPFAELARRQIA